MKLVLNPDYSRLKKLLQELPLSFATWGECIYKGRNELHKFSEGEQEFVVKRYKIPLFINRVAYTFFRPGKAQRAYEYALRLRELGIETPAPVAYIEEYSGRLLSHSYFVSENCPYPRMMREFNDGGVVGREHILKALAAFTANLHEKGIWHLDYSSGNILFDDRQSEVVFSIIDLNRMRFTRMSRKACLANFCRICRDWEVIQYIVEEYARLRGWERDSSLIQAQKEHCHFWKNADSKKRRKLLRQRFSSKK